MKIKAKAGWVHFTSWYLLPTIRANVDRDGFWFYFMWLKFDAGFSGRFEAEPIKAGGTSSD